MLEVFREVEATGEPIVVTDRGREVLEVRPYRANNINPSDVLKRLRSLAVLQGEISEQEAMAPLPELDWMTLRDDQNLYNNKDDQNGN